MKTLKTEAQTELQELFVMLSNDTYFANLSPEIKANVFYWALELKPKRVRRNPKEVTE